MKVQIFTKYMITQYTVKVNIILCFFLIHNDRFFPIKKIRIYIDFWMLMVYDKIAKYGIPGKHTYWVLLFNERGYLIWHRSI